jgi:ribosome-binding protein aMBF1 (putative translation factor)
MQHKRVKLTDQLRQAIDACGMSRYSLCQQIGLDQAVMSKFMAGKCGLSVSNIDKLADLLELDIVARVSHGRKER